MRITLCTLAAQSANTSTMSRTIIVSVCAPLQLKALIDSQMPAIRLRRHNVQHRPYGHPAPDELRRDASLSPYGLLSSSPVGPPERASSSAWCSPPDSWPHRSTRGGRAVRRNRLRERGPPRRRGEGGPGGTRNARSPSVAVGCRRRGSGRSVGLGGCGRSVSQGVSTNLIGSPIFFSSRATASAASASGTWAVMEGARSMRPADVRLMSCSTCSGPEP